MPSPISLAYLEWRLQNGHLPRLRDDGDAPPERLLQAIWQHQRLLRDKLRTLNDQPVRILHPGFLSVEGGPDFRSAVIQFPDSPPVTGDVEVDLRSSGWRVHGHDRNPAFSNVILHVVWEAERESQRFPATLRMRDYLDAPVGELSVWLVGGGQETMPKASWGRCSAVLSKWPEQSVLELLSQAGMARLRSKGLEFQARARQGGWEQALWEGVFRALGYKHNRWPMQCVAELRDRWLTPGTNSLELEARLFGIGGLLPTDLQVPARRGRGLKETGREHVRKLWDLWWRERDSFADCVLPRRLWRMHGVRPANHPERRMALAAHWVTAGDLVDKIEKWCAHEIPGEHACRTLAEALAVPEDAFWNQHWTLGSRKLDQAQPLLGASRVSDLAVNVFLPWLWIRAADGANEALRKSIEDRYLGWPAAQDNAVLRHARQRLFGWGAARKPPGAAAQQGLIQIVRDFCDHSNAVCDGCRLPHFLESSSSSTI